MSNQHGPANLDVERCTKIEKPPFGRWETPVLQSDSPAKQRVLVVSGCPAFRAELNRIVQGEGDFVVCGEVETARTVSMSVARLNPDIAVLHFESETVNNLALIHFLRTKYPALRILVVSDQNDEVCAERALRLGANGYLPRTEMAHECVHALRVVARMEAYTTPAIAARMLKKAHTAGQASDKPVPGLTRREMKILGLLAAGLDRTEIARRLHVTPRAVDAHCVILRRKLRLRTNEALKAYASGRV